MPNLPLPVHTERLVLRPFRLDDVDATLAYRGDPGVARFIPREPWTREQTQERVREYLGRTSITGSSSVLSLAVERSGRMIGDVVLWPLDDSLTRGEAGWAFHPEVAGRGYATEAVMALFGLAFGPLRMHRVTANVDARNTASWRLCERLGMTREGLLRRDLPAKDGWADRLVYGLLAEEWLDREAGS